MKIGQNGILVCFFEDLSKVAPGHRQSLGDERSLRPDCVEQEIRGKLMSIGMNMKRLGEENTEKALRMLVQDSLFRDKKDFIREILTKSMQKYNYIFEEAGEEDS